MASVNVYPRSSVLRPSPFVTTAQGIIATSMTYSWHWVVLELEDLSYPKTGSLSVHPIGKVSSGSLLSWSFLALLQPAELYRLGPSQSQPCLQLS